LILCSDCLYSSASVMPLLSVLEKVIIIQWVSSELFIIVYFKLSNPSKSTIILLVNEMRTAFDEFTYLARRSETFEAYFTVIFLKYKYMDFF
jgi:hypothetical protein